MKDFLELTKPRITFMALLMTAGGFSLAPYPFDGLELFFVLLGTGLIVASANTFNMVLEQDIDAKMERTKNRPLPAHRLSPKAATLFGTLCGLLSLYILWVDTHPLTTLLGVLAFIIYVALYTPLKRLSPWALIVGAIPGAMPPLMGWSAAAGTIELPGVILFCVLAVWQIPHFIAITMYREAEYRRAGIQTLNLVHGQRMAVRQACLYATLLIPISLLLITTGMVTWVYGIVAVGAGLIYMVTSFQGFSVAPDAIPAWGRKLFLTSLLYLPLIALALLVDVIWV